MASYIHQINGLSIAASEAVPGSPLANALSAISGGAFRIVPLTTGDNPVPDPEHAEPPVPLSGKIIYLTKDEHSTATDPYTEWIWIEGTDGNPDKWEIIGTTSVALDDLHADKTSGDGINFQIEVVEVDGKITEVHVIDDKTEAKTNKITAWGTPTDIQYPSAKLVKDSLDTKADKVSVPAGTDPSGHLPELDENGNLDDSGIEAADVVTDVTVNSASVVDRATKTAVIPTAAPGANDAPGNYGVVTIATMET
jgi:hypothetical protein